MEDNIKWTIETYAIHNEALREAEKRFQEERDRRYSEVNEAKELAENNALRLAREIQVYKDEKANELREQINAERLLYVRKEDISSMKDKYDGILEFVATKRGSEKGVDKTLYYLIALIGVLIGVIGLLVAYFK